MNDTIKQLRMSDYRAHCPCCSSVLWEDAEQSDDRYIVSCMGCSYRIALRGILNTLEAKQNEQAVREVEHAIAQSNARQAAAEPQDPLAAMVQQFKAAADHLAKKPDRRERFLIALINAHGVACNSADYARDLVYLAVAIDKQLSAIEREGTPDEVMLPAQGDLVPDGT